MKIKYFKCIEFLNICYLDVYRTHSIIMHTLKYNLIFCLHMAKFIDVLCFVLLNGIHKTSIAYYPHPWISCTIQLRGKAIHNLNTNITLQCALNTMSLKRYRRKQTISTWFFIERFITLSEVFSALTSPKLTVHHNEKYSLSQESSIV